MIVLSVSYFAPMSGVKSVILFDDQYTFNWFSATKVGNFALEHNDPIEFNSFCDKSFVYKVVRKTIDCQSVMEWHEIRKQNKFWDAIQPMRVCVANVDATSGTELSDNCHFTALLEWKDGYQSYYTKFDEFKDDEKEKQKIVQSDGTQMFLDGLYNGDVVPQRENKEYYVWLFEEMRHSLVEKQKKIKATTKVDQKYWVDGVELVRRFVHSVDLQSDRLHQQSILKLMKFL